MKAHRQCSTPVTNSSHMPNFPEGVTLGFSDYDEYRSLPQRTQDAIARGDQVLFQPRFEWQDFTCICDIVSFVGDDEADLYEIKASTSAKVDHEFDLALQIAVLEGAGLGVRNILVIHVNNQYVRHGEIEADKITTITDVTDKVRARGEATAKYMPMALAVANSSQMPDPDPSLAKLGSKNDWLKIYENIYPPEPKVWPEDTRPEIDAKEIKNFLEGLQYPLYFLDYETMSLDSVLRRPSTVSTSTNAVFASRVAFARRRTRTQRIPAP
jgi:hypothetical protein